MFIEIAYLNTNIESWYLIVPIKAAANELSLPIHELDTFTRWTV